MNAYGRKKLIGAGSYGKVYIANKDGKKYAIKEDIRGLSQSYLREVATLRLIGSDEKRGIISYKEFIPEEAAIVLEYMKTDLLTDLYKGAKLLDKDSTLDLLYGLLFLHSRGILHRDLKENNILCSGANNDFLFITDFGISRWLGGGGITLTPGIFPRELSPPEIIEGSITYTFSSDVWCLGIIILEMYLGTIIDFPGRAASKEERLIFIDNLVHTPYTTGTPKLEQYHRDGLLTDEQYKLVSSMLQFDPRLRPQVNELLTSLGENIIPFNKDYTESILRNTLALDTQRVNTYDPKNRLFLSTVFRSKTKVDTSHLAIRYYDITGMDINICLELASRINEIYHKENRKYDADIIKLIKQIDYQMYQPTPINIYRLYRKRTYQNEIQLLNIAVVSGITLQYGIDRVVKSIINDDDLINEIISLDWVLL